MSRTHQLCLLFSFVAFCFPLPALAQRLLDPNFVEFTASADHHTLDENGQPIVSRYDFLLYTIGSASPTRTVSLGKPTPGASGTIRLALNTILSPLPAGGTTYEVRIAAVGPGGSAPSDPSNGFSFQVTCTYSLSPASRSVGAASGSSTFSVTAPAGCAWTAATTASWIAITGGANGAGNGTVAFTNAANSATAIRIATMMIAGQTRNVSQAGAPCTYTVSPTSRSVVRAGGNVTFAVTSPAGCNWAASEQSSWISIASGATGSGNGTITFAVAANTGTVTRTASATVAGRTVTLSQSVATRPGAPTGFRVVR